MAATGVIFNVERFAVHDGPGIRVTVFFKGCPLRCLWCHSPESQTRSRELLLKADRCISCGTCVPFCPAGAIHETETGFDTDRAECRVCDECSDACPTSARSLAGRTVTTSDLLREIERDQIFFGTTGGVTFSGGEPLMQRAFLAEAIAACRAAGIHTAVETSGFGSRRAIADAATADLVFFDLKIIDEARHRLATGGSNRLILDNFAWVTAHHPAVRVRVPLVPGLTDDVDNLEGIGRLVSVSGLRQIDLLPYHASGLAKYDRLGRPYALRGVRPPDAEAIAVAARCLEQFGLAVHIGG